MRNLEREVVLSYVCRRTSLIAFATLLLLPPSALAIPITVTGNATGSLATATGNLTLSGNLLTLSLTNTSPFAAAIAGVGFDLVSGDFGGNQSAGLNGFTAGTGPGKFKFTDGALGNVPDFGAIVLDYGWTTGNSGNFSGGKASDGISPGGTVVFAVTGNFTGFTEDELALGLFVRFQNVGPNEDDGDVGHGTPPLNAVPEPSSMLLLGAGLAVFGLRPRSHTSKR